MITIEQITAACEAASVIVQETDKAKGHTLTSKIVFDGMGKKYTRLILADLEGSSRSAWCFVDNETGQLFKPASWKAPTKNFARGELADLHKPEFVTRRRYGF